MPIERPDWNVVPVENGPTDEEAVGFPEPVSIDQLEVPVAQSGGDDLDPALLAEWDRAGGIDFHLGQAQGAVEGMLDALPEDERAEFEGGFDALPRGVQSAVFSELALGTASFARPASEADLARFASTEEGAELVKEWRGKASRNLGVINARFNRIFSRLGGDEIDAIYSWFDELDSTRAGAVLRALVRRN